MADSRYERKMREQRLTFLPSEEHQQQSIASMQSLSSKQLYQKHKRGVLLSAKTRATPKGISDHKTTVSQSLASVSLPRKLPRAHQRLASAVSANTQRKFKTLDTFDVGSEQQQTFEAGGTTTAVRSIFDAPLFREAAGRQQVRVPQGKPAHHALGSIDQKLNQMIQARPQSTKGRTTIRQASIRLSKPKLQGIRHPQHNATRAPLSQASRASKGHPPFGSSIPHRNGTRTSNRGTAAISTPTGEQIQTIAVSDQRQRKSVEFDEDKSSAAVLAASEEGKFDTVRAFLKEPKVSLEYVRSLPAARRQEAEFARAAGSLDLNAVRQKIESATCSLSRGQMWGQEGGYLRSNHSRAISGYLDSHKNFKRNAAPRDVPFSHRKSAGETSSLSRGLHTLNFSGRAIDQRTKFICQQNLLSSEHALSQITQDKEAQQYTSYLSNVQTLNRMKQAFKDLHPAMGNTDGKKQRLANIIINYEKDIQEYVNIWSNQNNQEAVERVSQRDIDDIRVQCEH